MVGVELRSRRHMHVPYSLCCSSSLPGGSLQCRGHGAKDSIPTSNLLRCLLGPAWWWRDIVPWMVGVFWMLDDGGGDFINEVVDVGPVTLGSGFS